MDNYTVQAYPYTWNFTDESLWEKSESQFVSEIWTPNTAGEDNEWRNTGHEPTVATGYDVDLLRGLRFIGHVCAGKDFLYGCRHSSDDQPGSFSRKK